MEVLSEESVELSSLDKLASPGLIITNKVPNDKLVDTEAQKKENKVKFIVEEEKSENNVRADREQRSLNSSRPLVELDKTGLTTATIQSENYQKEDGFKTHKRHHKKHRKLNIENSLSTHDRTLEITDNVSNINKKRHKRKHRVKKHMDKNSKVRSEESGFEVDLNKFRYSNLNKTNKSINNSSIIVDLNNNQYRSAPYSILEEKFENENITKNFFPILKKSTNEGEIVVDLNQVNDEINKKNKDQELFNGLMEENVPINPEEGLEDENNKLKLMGDNAAKIQIQINTVQIKKPEKVKHRKKLLVRDQTKMSKFVKQKIEYGTLFNMPVFCRGIVEDCVYRALNPWVYENKYIEDTYIEYSYEYSYEDINSDVSYYYYYYEEEEIDDEYDYYYVEYSVTEENDIPDVDHDYGKSSKKNDNELDESAIIFADYPQIIKKKVLKKKKVPKKTFSLLGCDLNNKKYQQKFVIKDSAADSGEINLLYRKIYRNLVKNSKTAINFIGIVTFISLVLYVVTFTSNEIYQRAACIGIKNAFIKNIRKKHKWTSRVADTDYFKGQNKNFDMSGADLEQMKFKSDQERQTYMAMNMGDLEGFFGLAPLWFNYKGRWLRRVPESTFEEYEKKREIMRTFVASQLPFSDIYNIDKCLNYILPQEHEQALYNLGHIGNPKLGDRLKGGLNYFSRAAVITDFVVSETKQKNRNVLTTKFSESNKLKKYLTQIMYNSVSDTTIRAMFEVLRKKFMISKRSLDEINNDKRIPHSQKQYDGYLTKWAMLVFEKYVSDASIEIVPIHKKGSEDLKKKKDKILDYLNESFFSPI